MTELQERAAMALEEAASDAEALARHEYGDPPHPALRSKYNRDMEIAREYRELARQLRECVTRCNAK